MTDQIDRLGAQLDAIEEALAIAQQEPQEGRRRHLLTAVAHAAGAARDEHRAADGERRRPLRLIKDESSPDPSSPQETSPETPGKFTVAFAVIAASALLLGAGFSAGRHTGQGYSPATSPPPVAAPAGTEPASSPPPTQSSEPTAERPITDAPAAVSPTDVGHTADVQVVLRVTPSAPAGSMSPAPASPTTGSAATTEPPEVVESSARPSPSSPCLRLALGRLSAGACR